METAHRILAGVVGELSLALSSHRGSRANLIRWAKLLRDVAAMMERKASGRD